MLPKAYIILVCRYVKELADAELGPIGPALAGGAAFFGLSVEKQIHVFFWPIGAPLRLPPLGSLANDLTQQLSRESHCYWPI